MGGAATDDVVIAGGQGGTHGRSAYGKTSHAQTVEPRHLSMSTTFLVVKVDPADVKLPDLGLLMSPQATQAYQQFAKLADNWLQQLRTVVGDRPLYATIGIPISQQRIPIFVFVATERESGPTRCLPQDGVQNERPPTQRLCRRDADASSGGR